VFKLLGDFTSIKTHAFIGGTNFRTDIKNIADGVHVIVGTPGRVQDMINKDVLKLTNLKIFILDEADELLGRGFLDSIKLIISYIPEKCQVALFSATMPKDVISLTKNFLNNPAKILVKNEMLTLEGKYYLNCLYLLFRYKTILHSS